MGIPRPVPGLRTTHVTIAFPVSFQAPAYNSISEASPLAVLNRGHIRSFEVTALVYWAYSTYINPSASSYSSGLWFYSAICWAFAIIWVTKAQPPSPVKGNGFRKARPWQSLLLYLKDSDSIDQLQTEKRPTCIMQINVHSHFFWRG